MILPLLWKERCLKLYSDKIVYHHHGPMEMHLLVYLLIFTYLQIS